MKNYLLIIVIFQLSNSAFAVDNSAPLPEIRYPAVKAVKEDYKRFCEAHKEYINKEYRGCFTKIAADPTVGARGSDDYYIAGQMSEAECDRYCPQVWEINKAERQRLAQRKDEPLEIKPCFIEEAKASSKDDNSCEVIVACPVAGAEFRGIKFTECTKTAKGCGDFKVVDATSRYNLTEKDSTTVRSSFGSVGQEAAEAKKVVCARFESVIGKKGTSSSSSAVTQ
jgi:hypothetical protein